MELFKTERLALRQCELFDDEFVLELLNTPAWLAYIGDRQVHDEEAARQYIRRVPFKSYEENGFGLYTVVHLETKKAIGLCGFIKRSYLQFPDLGFAFLPEYWKKGYAYEAAQQLIQWGFENLETKKFHAITLPGNQASIGLLTKLGFKYEHEFISDDTSELLKLFSLYSSR